MDVICTPRNAGGKPTHELHFEKKGSLTQVNKLQHKMALYLYPINKRCLQLSQNGKDKNVFLACKKYCIKVNISLLHRQKFQVPLTPELSVEQATVAKVNPLSPDIKMHILLTVVHMFHMIPLGRICLHIKTFHLW